jgi:hypothetical protein
MVTSSAFHFALLAGLTAQAIGASGPMVFPGSDWKERTPESQGVDSVMLEEAINYLHDSFPPDFSSLD